MQDPSLLERQFAQGFPAFTQAQPLQEPVLLHLQHGMVQLSLLLSPQSTLSPQTIVGKLLFEASTFIDSQWTKSSVLCRAIVVADSPCTVP